MPIYLEVAARADNEPPLVSLGSRLESLSRGRDGGEESGTVSEPTCEAATF